MTDFPLRSKCIYRKGQEKSPFLTHDNGRQVDATRSPRLFPFGFKRRIPDHHSVPHGEKTTENEPNAPGKISHGVHFAVWAREEKEISRGNGGEGPK